MRKSIQNCNETFFFLEDKHCSWSYSSWAMFVLKHIKKAYVCYGTSEINDILEVWLFSDARANLFGLKGDMGDFFTQITIWYKITENRKRQKMAFQQIFI